MCAVLFVERRQLRLGELKTTDIARGGATQVHIIPELKFLTTMLDYYDSS